MNQNLKIMNEFLWLYHENKEKSENLPFTYKVELSNYDRLYGENDQIDRNLPQSIVKFNVTRSLDYVILTINNDIFRYFVPKCDVYHSLHNLENYALSRFAAQSSFIRQKNCLPLKYINELSKCCPKMKLVEGFTLSNSSCCIHISGSECYTPFPEIDKCLGFESGDFFDRSNDISGCLLILNPPRTSRIVLKLIDKVKLMVKSSENFSIQMFLPDWEDVEEKLKLIVVGMYIKKIKHLNLYNHMKLRTMHNHNRLMLVCIDNDSHRLDEIIRIQNRVLNLN